jgi:phenylalanyl-tRNA synthetase beta chain
MKVSLNWLKEYVAIDMTVSALADALTMAGLEVEAVEDRYAYLKTVVVGRVVAVLPHPNADRLKLCRVDDGDGIVAVVCGAPNVTPGMLAPLARVGTRMPDGTRLERSVIRGQHSEGMLCSAHEIGLGPDSSGILALDSDLQPGLPLTRALTLSDSVLEIGLTPNRPDCLSLMGVAREIAAIQGIPMRPPLSNRPDTEDDLHRLTRVTIQAPNHCPRYAARLLDRITVGPSPFWLQDRLRAVGVRPINNLVDVTNFVMLETGQPLHAFDFDRLADQRIVVRTATEGERFTTLDQKERRLSEGMLLICDGEKPIAVGGVMGGLDSEIRQTTTRVLIESACFDPISIRRTSKTLGLNTEASHRFERGVDPDGTLFALDRAAVLMAELGQGRLVGGVIDEDFRTQGPRILALSVQATNHLLGTDLDHDRIATLLESIAFTVNADGGDDLQVQVPSFRVDVTRSQDLMEEVARRSGYGQIPTTFPALPAQGTTACSTMVRRNHIRNILAGFGFSEVINYSFISADSCDRIQLAASDPRRSHVGLLNPISEEQAVMRTTLVPGILETVQRNISRQQNHLRLFEIGHVFLPQPDALLPLEQEMLTAVWTGPRTKATWLSPETGCDFFDIKGIVEGLARAMNLAGLTFHALPDDRCDCTRAGHTAQIRCSGQMLGIVGEVDAAVLNRYGIKQSVFIFELNVAGLGQLAPDFKQMTPIPRFPATARDMTVIVDQGVEAARLLDAVARFDEKLVVDLHLFAVFSGDPLPAGKKSVSLRVVYRSAERTLADETVNEIHRRLTCRLIAEFDATLPA